MNDYQPQPGERAVLYGSAMGRIEVLVADYRGHFQQVGDYHPGVPYLVWRPYAASSATEVRTLDQDTQAWSWDTLMEAKRRHEACLLYTSPSPRDKRQSRMPSSA